jgi:hypothetical protein
MRKTLSLIAALTVLALSTSQVLAQNLLVNPGLDDPPIHEGATATGWTLETFKTNSGPSDTANFPTFADRAAPDGRGLWYRAFLGTPADPAQANLTQTVPGIAGAKYVMTGWAHFETFYPGGLDNINAGTGPPDPTNDGQASPTDTVFALEFLGLNNQVLPASVQVELRANGQTNDPDTSPTTGGGRDWMQHMLMATAPPGTLFVQVRSSMVNGILNPGVNPQSAFVDDFSLTIIPEPASVMLGLIGVLGLLGLARRR